MTTINNLIAELEDVIAQGSIEHRIKALDRLTNLFMSASNGFREAQVATLDELFLRFSTDIESAARRVLAIRLADAKYAPPKVVLALAADEAIEVANPILSRSACLDERALINIVTTKSQEYLLAVSTRQSLGPAITDVLVSRGDQAVLRSTARNNGAKFSDGGYQKLVDRAYGDDELTESVGSRPDIPRYLYVEIVKKASDAVRTKLESAQPNIAQEIQQTIAEVASVIRSKTARGSHDYSKAEKYVKSLHVTGRLGASEVEAFAKAKQIEDTTAALAIMGDLPIEEVERAIIQDRTELLIFVARAIGLPWSATKAVLLLRSGPLGLSSATIEQCLGNFERLKPSTAQHAMRFYLLRGQKSGPQSSLGNLNQAIVSA